MTEMHRFENNAALASVLAAHIAADLTAALDTRGGASLAVSGGSTPLPLFAALARESLDWSRVGVTLVDERWVDESHADSNAALVRSALLQGKAAAATFIPLKTTADSPCEAQAEVAHELDALSWPLDVAVLGMGEDGHTASFFPGAQTLGAALDPKGSQRCIAVTPPVAPHPRMTLTLPALLAARHCYLHITGDAKLGVLEQALRPGDAAQLPIRAVLRGRGDAVDIYHATRS